jgi:hypothetical protein
MIDDEPYLLAFAVKCSADSGQQANFIFGEEMQFTATSRGHLF